VDPQCVHGIAEFMASSLAEKNHNPIRKKNGKSKIRKNKTRYREAKTFCVRKMEEKPTAC
jgi:hypothetical protein